MLIKHPIYINKLCFKNLRQKIYNKIQHNKFPYQRLLQRITRKSTKFRLTNIITKITEFEKKPRSKRQCISKMSSLVNIVNKSYINKLREKEKRKRIQQRMNSRQDKYQFDVSDELEEKCHVNKIANPIIFVQSATVYDIGTSELTSEPISRINPITKKFSWFIPVIKQINVTYDNFGLDLMSREAIYNFICNSYVKPSQNPEDYRSIKILTYKICDLLTVTEARQSLVLLDRYLRTPLLNRLVSVRKINIYFAASVVISAKLTDDAYGLNSFFANELNIYLKVLNKAECNILKALNFNVYVTKKQLRRFFNIN